MQRRTQFARERTGAATGRGGRRHQALGGLVEAQRDGDRDVDDHVQPQDLQRVERHSAGDAEDPGHQEDRDVGHQGGHLEPEVLHQVVVERAAVGDRADDGGEVVVGEDHHRGLLGDLGAGDPHRDADVRSLQRRGVVHAVAGHRDDVALSLQQLDQPDLVLGRDPGDHADLGQLLEQLVVAHRGELGAGDRAALDPQLTGDRGRGGGVVAGDHPDPDAGVVALGDRRLRLRTRRVHDADHRQQREVGDQLDEVTVGLGSWPGRSRAGRPPSPARRSWPWRRWRRARGAVLVGDRQQRCRRARGSCRRARPARQARP